MAPPVSDSGAPKTAMRIAVTGASGFVGRSLIAHGTASGAEMIAVVRRESPLTGATQRIVPDITDTAALTRAFAGADAVVHLAARVHVMHREGREALARFRAVNVDGTRAVVDACGAAGVRRLVFLSTAKVLGEGGNGVLRDDAPLAPQGAYAQSKAEAEELVAAVAPAGLAWTILRPPLVYGPGVGGNFRRLLRLAQIGATFPVPLGAVRNQRSLVAVRNLAAAALHALRDPRAAGHRYLVSDGEDLSTAELLRRLGELRGRRVRLLAVPPFILRGALRVLGKGAEADRLLESFAVDSSGIRRELDWIPPLRLDEALGETLAWWTERGAA